LTSSKITVTKDGTSVTFTGRFKDAVFSKYITKQPYPGRVIADRLDNKNSYDLNSHGYRGPEFSSGVELLTAGCSQTFGVGVPEDGTWPHLMAKQSGMSYANLSYPSVSIEWIVNSLYRYFDEFGHPKNLVCYFPDLFRSDEIINSLINSTSERSILEFPNYRSDKDGKKGIILSCNLSVNLDNRAKLSKRPYSVENTTPPESPVAKSIANIRNLERYCKTAGIKLVWSGWSDDVNKLMHSSGHELQFSNYLRIQSSNIWKSSYGDRVFYSKTNPDQIKDYILEHKNTNNESIDKYGCTDEMSRSGNCVCYTLCHHELESKFVDSFHMGTDRYKNDRDVGSHMGVHRHIHVAEEFLEALNDV